MATGTVCQPHPNGQKSHLLSLLLLPGTLTRLQMRSLHLDPRKRTAQGSTFLSAQMQGLSSNTAAGERELRGSIQFQPQSGQRLRGTLGSCLPVHAHFSLASFWAGVWRSQGQGSHPARFHGVTDLNGPVLLALKMSDPDSGTCLFNTIDSRQTDLARLMPTVQLFPTCPAGRKPEKRGVNSQDLGS